VNLYVVYVVLSLMLRKTYINMYDF